jgi:hypothetical protein
MSEIYPLKSSLWALPFWLEVAQGRLQSQFWSNTSCTSHKGAGQWSKQGNKKQLERGTTQHQQGERSYNRTRTRKHAKSQARKSQSSYIYEMYMIVKG